MTAPVLVGCDLLSAYGPGRERFLAGLYAGQVAVRASRRFRIPGGRPARVGAAPLPRHRGGMPRILRLAAALFEGRPPPAPPDAALLLATTTGAIECTERLALTGQGHPEEARLPELLPAIQALAGLRGPAAVVSAACASSTAALWHAGRMLRCGEADAVLVVGADALSEFLVSGFSSLMALDEKAARPFDRDRAGLNPGEAAGYLLLMSAARAAREHRPVLAGLAGAAMTCDANHMTGPSRDGAGLARAAAAALAQAGLDPGAVALVAAHGTGTRYNDAMEMKALSSLFTAPRPTFSVKGGIGHTMGSAGLAQVLAAVEALRRGEVPPTPGVRNVDDDALGWVSSAVRPCVGNAALVLNAGFGGINAAAVLTRPGVPEALP